jgi:hypothetical protein
MKRREFMAGAAALLVPPRRSWAQGTPRRIGVLNPGTKNLPNDLPIQKVWLDSLRDHGWVVGKNLRGMPSTCRLSRPSLSLSSPTCSLASRHSQPWL